MIHKAGRQYLLWLLLSSSYDDESTACELAQYIHIQYK